MEIRGRWYALTNRDARRTGTDTVVLRPMTPREVETYQSMKQSGFVEAAIFAQLYATQPEPAQVQDVIVPVALLNKKQLAILIENKLSASLPSLKKMDVEDLVRLLGRL